MKLTEKQDNAVRKLKDISPENEIFWDDTGKFPKFIKGTLSGSSQDSPETIAREFLDSIKELLDFQEGLKEELKLSHIEENRDGSHHVYFQQILNDVNVFEGSTQVHINADGTVVAYKDYRLTGVEVATEPKIDESTATEVVLKDLERTDVAKDAQLSLYRDNDKKVHLAWEIGINVEGERGRRCYFVDAQTGALLYKYAQIRDALSRATYTADNEKVLPGELVIRNDEQSSDEVVQAAHDHAKTVYDYYLETFGRDSYDGRGALLKSTVHFGEDYNNAFWTDLYAQMVYGDGDGVRWKPLALALDIVGHELTHAVTSRTARFVYAEQSGALDECFADILGVMVSNDDPITNWEMGEGVRTPYIEGDALRDLSDPTKYGQPDHMDDFRYLSPGEMPDPEKNDNGWLHHNSGIPNKATYLIVAGGTHHGIRVSGIGRTKAEQIFYLALTVYLSSATDSRWTFEQARYAMLNACRQLYGDNGAEYRAIKNAWAAVGIGEPGDELVVIEEEVSPGISIPDLDPAGVRSIITVAQEGLLAELSLSINIEHSYIGDLRVALISPGDERVVLHNRFGGWQQNLHETYDLTTAPVLQAFVGDKIKGDWKLEVSDNARADTGTLVNWALKIAAQKVENKTLAKEVRPRKRIPDNDPTGIESEILVSESGQIVTLEIPLDITHTYIGDLRVVLVTPTGEEFVLHNRTGYSRRNIEKTYSTKSDKPLESLPGREIQGKWILKVMDLCRIDVGKLNQWGLNFNYA
ncbi:MAG: M4 family metallopeptidase [Planctomycetota bacterium]|jgi:Zn-dependent metalloprotease/subtilisin-like proprotein convertase family protein